MALNNGCFAEKRYLVNPKDLRFTHADIKFAFTDPRHPSVRETASLLRYGRLNPNVFAPLHVRIDEQGNIWSDNNRRLFALRHAGIDSIAVVFDGTRCPTKPSLKSKLSDPDFMPKIRAEAPRVQTPPPPTSGRNVYQIQKEPELSLAGSVSDGYLNRQPYNSHEDEEEEDELGAMFSQLAINGSTSTYSTHGESASSKQWGRVDPDDSAFMPSSVRGGSGFRITKPEDVVFMPTILGHYESGVQTPPPPSSGRNVENESSGRNALQYEDEDEDEGNGVEPCLSPFNLYHDYDYELYW